MPNPNMGEPRYETKMRRSRRATLVDAGQDLYVVITSIEMGMSVQRDEHMPLCVQGYW